MFDPTTPELALTEQPQTSPASTPTEEPGRAPEAVPQEPNGHDAARWHVEAGRKGARRVHQLIRLGRLYEQEHGLKRGRQRLRQLIEEGRLYEQEHGLSGQQEKRPPRMSREQALETFFEALARLAKPSVRKRLLQLLQALETEAK